MSYPVSRPLGRALIVGSADARAQPLSAMQTLGYVCAEADDPYAAAAELFRRPLVYRALVLSLVSLYREELTFIASLKRRLPRIDIWLTHLEGRQAALAEAMRLGADGLLGEDGALHRMAMTAAQDDTIKPAVIEPETADSAPLIGEFAAHGLERDSTSPEPLLSADELRALLQEQPTSGPETET